jgi:integrase
VDSRRFRAALLDYLRSSRRLHVLRDDDPLWTLHDRAGESGEPLSSWSFVENLKRCAKEAGIGKIHLHQTRHTFSRMVAERTGSLSETQEALGHRHVATTRVYVDSVAKKPDKHSRHILAALDLPEIEEVEPFYDRCRLRRMTNPFPHHRRNIEWGFIFADYCSWLEIELAPRAISLR